MVTDKDFAPHPNIGDAIIALNRGVLWLRRNYPAPLRSCDYLGHPLMSAPALYPDPGHCIDPGGTRVRLEGFPLPFTACLGFPLTHKTNLAPR